MQFLDFSNPRIRGTVVLLLMTAAGLRPLPVLAHDRSDKDPRPTDRATISGNAFQGARGVISVNQTAGDGNEQANVVLVSTHAGGGVHVRQTTAVTRLGREHVNISGDAFSNSAGIVQVNQSAGSGDAQANVVVMQLGTTGPEMTDAALAAAVPVQQTLSSPLTDAHAHDKVMISKHAFAGAKGIIQIDQVAGSGNATANSFVLQIQAPGHQR